jgi:hypothetical protein
MTTHPVYDDTGRAFAFEVEAIYLPLASGVSLLRPIDGVSDVRRRRLFHRPADIHIRFRYRGVPFVLWEPYGDSSRYWIGPEDERGDHPDVGDLRAAFARHRPPIWVKVLAYLFRFQFLQGRNKSGDK